MNEVEQQTIAAPERCVVIVDQALYVGRAANAAAVMALTLGQRHPGLVGEALIDARQRAWPGLIPIGIPVLAANTLHLQRLQQYGASQSLSTLNISAFNIGNTLGAWVGGTVIDAVLGLTMVPLAG